jgi:hypothetical protein
MDIWVTTLGISKKTNLNKIQVFRNITLRNTTNAPFYIFNLILHQDLGIKPVTTEVDFF